MMDFINSLHSKMGALSARQMLFALLAISLLLGVLTLNRGLQSDDFVQQVLMQNDQLDTREQLLNFYHFFKEKEVRPWWFDSEVKIKFFRPLSALSHSIDYALWPTSPKLMHLHSVAWYMLLVTLCFLFFKKLFNKNLAALAGLIFCVDFSHFANISWLANRNSLITACLIVAALYYYLEFRSQTSNMKKSFGFYCSSLLMFSLALLSSESSIATIGLLIIFELSLRKKNTTSSTTSILALGGFLAIGIVWFFSYQHFGFGSVGNSLYRNPSDDFALSFQLIISKVPVYFLGLFFGAEGFYNVLSPSIKILASILSAGLVFSLFFITRNIFNIKYFSFFFVACLGLLILPSFAAPVDMRYGFLASIFSAVMIAMLINVILSAEKERAFYKPLLILLLVMHLLVSPSQWVLTGLRDWVSPPQPYQDLIDVSHKYPNSDIYIVAYPRPIDSYYFNILHKFNTKPLVIEHSVIHILTNNYSDYSLINNLPENITLLSAKGFVFKPSDANSQVNGHKKPLDKKYATLATNAMLSEENFREGQKIKGEGFSTEIISVNQVGLVEELRFIFDKTPLQQHVREHDPKSGQNKRRVFLEWLEHEKRFKKL